MHCLAEQLDWTLGFSIQHYEPVVRGKLRDESWFLGLLPQKYEALGEKMRQHEKVICLCQQLPPSEGMMSRTCLHVIRNQYQTLNLEPM